MEKLNLQAKDGFSLLEMIAVLFIVSIIIITLSLFSINNYNKYQERLAASSLISDLYYVQTKSLADDEVNFVRFYQDDGEYKIHVGRGDTWKKLAKGRVLLNSSYVDFEYRKGNLVSKANTIVAKFDHSSYKIIVHLDSGFISVDEV